MVEALTSSSNTDGADAVGYVELFATLLHGELWVRVHRIQNVAKGAAGIVSFESGDYHLVEWLDLGGGVRWQEDELDIQVNHLQVPGVARSVIDKQENLERKVFFLPGTSPPEGQNSYGASQ